MSVSLPYFKSYQYATNRIINSLFTDSLFVTLEEEYKTSPSFNVQQTVAYPTSFGITYEETVANVTLNSLGRAALYLDTNPTQVSILIGALNTVSFTTTVTYSYTPAVNTFTNNNIPRTAYPMDNGTTVDNTFTTNIPVFETQAEAENYLTIASDAGALEYLQNHALNFKSGEVAPIERDFEITNAWTHGTWINDIQPNVTTVTYRNVRGKIVDGAIALYDISGIDDGKLRIGVINNATFSDLQYSTDGSTWTDTNSFPYTFFLRRRIDELGEFDYGLTFGGNKIPKFDDQTTAQGFINGTVDITEANNWGEISASYPITNYTGDEETESDFGEVYTRGFFSQQYILTDGALQELANALFDTTPNGIWEDIKKGLDMFGSDPIQAVMGLSFWPFPVGSVISGTQNQSYVYFGGFKFNFASHTADKIIYPNGYKSIGMVRFRRSFNSWRDMEPYTKLYVMLPYCGTYQLDLARYYDKNVEVRYYFDTRTNGCIACLIADGFLVDYFNGQMGVTMPITLTDYSGYANAQIHTLLGGGGQAAQSFGGAAGMVGGASAAGGAALAGAAVGGALSVGISGAAVGAKMVYGLSQNNINNFNKTKGGSSSMINEYLPQSVCFIFEIQEDCAPENYGEMFGYPSMKAGKIFNFSGFLKCQAIKLSCGIATERERERLKQMLLSGIYI